MTAPTSTVERYCVFCQADRQVHAETGRCQTCGRSTVPSGDLLRPSANGTNIAPPPRSAAAPGKLVLVETAELRRWVDLTRSLSGKLKARAANAEQQADRFRADAQHLARAASAFAGLLDQIGIETKPAASTQRGRALPEGQWSRVHSACVRCGKTERKHKAHGLCERCHSQKERANAD